MKKCKAPQIVGVCTARKHQSVTVLRLFNERNPYKKVSKPKTSVYSESCFTLDTKALICFYLVR